MNRFVCFSIIALAACGGSSEEPATTDTAAPTDDTAAPTDDSETTDDTGSTAGGDCEAGCVATVAADCPNGPASQADCVADCEMLLEGACQAEYQALLTCGAGSTISCDPTYGFPLLDDCPTEQDAFLLCLNG